MRLFRKKPVVIEAVPWTGKEEDLPEIFALIDFESLPDDGVHVNKGIGYVLPLGTLDIPTLEGTMTAQPGDWIIKGVKGEVYPCKPDIFDATYEPVEGDKMSDHGIDSPGNNAGIDPDFVDRQLVEEALERLLIGDDHMGTQPEEAFGRLMLKQDRLREALSEAMDAVIWFSGLPIPPGGQESWEEIRDEQMPKWRELLKES